jgi:hypothetical protein
MEKQWWCVSCLSEIELDTHGRCSACGSDAIGMIVFRTAARPADDIAILAEGGAPKELIA